MAIESSMAPALFLTKDNIEEVAAQTGRSEFSLVKMLIRYTHPGRPWVKVPVYKRRWR